MEVLYVNAMKRPTVYTNPTEYYETQKDGKLIFHKEGEEYRDGKLVKPQPQIDRAKIYFMYYYEGKDTTLKELQKHPNIEGVELLVREIKSSKNAIDLFSK